MESENCPIKTDFVQIKMNSNDNFNGKPLTSLALFTSMFSAFCLCDILTYLNVRTTKDLDASEHIGSSWSTQAFFEYIHLRHRQSTFSKELKNPPIKMMY